MPRYGYKPPQRMFKPLDPGTYIAWLVQFIDLGTHTEETQWGTKDVRKGRFVFAVPDVLTDAGRPMVVGTTMSLTTHEKGNYRKMIQSWTGRAFNDQSFMDYDDRELFNIPVMIQVGHKGEADDAYAIILSYNMPLRGIPINGLPEDQEYLYLSLEPDRFDNNEFEKLDSMMTEKSAAKLKEQITTSFEWEKLCNPPADQPAQEEAPEDVWHTEDPLPPEDAQPEEEAPAPEPAPPPGCKPRNPSPPIDRAGFATTSQRYPPRRG